MENKIDFAVGGQAVIEGVMMRSPNFTATAVRKKNGEIKIQDKPFKSITAKYKLLKIPFVRGIINLFEMLIIGMHSINFSAQEYADDFDETPTEEKQEKSNLAYPAYRPPAGRAGTGKRQAGKIWDTLAFALSIVFSLALAIFLFKFIPLAITEWLRSKFPYIAENYIIFNAIDGSIRIAIFLLYIFTLSIFKSFRRIFEYHGAEHKSIFTYEKNLALIPENAKVQSRFHPRCGTSFIVIVFLISIAIYTFVPRNPVFWINLTQRIFVLPLIAAVGYEILKWSAKRMDHAFVKILIAPGLWTQRITTKEPDDTQLEVALHALQKTLELEGMGAK
ncbi:DUF1385 domain-containing protein [Candidatus Peregrinibacteria bacterium]|nr:DUF1385 domain-containing protein [Candidatus Peregrinibacteria bacterium]